MYPYSCHEDPRFCSDIARLNDSLIRLNHNQTNAESSRGSRSRLRDYQISASKSGSVKCECTLTETQHRDKFLDALVKPRSKYASPNLSKSQLLKPSGSCTSTRSDLPTRGQARKTGLRRNRERELNVKAKRSESYSVCVTETPNRPKHFLTAPISKAISSKKVKKKQSIRFQDTEIGKSRYMDVIKEEQEENASDSNSKLGFESGQGKKMQDSCADFLNIMHDTVLETVKRSVESILKDYLEHSMEKIENLCAHMGRNDTLMSQMYLDIMEKIADQNERNQFQFNKLHQCLLELKNNSGQEKICRDMDFNSSCTNKNRASHCSCSFEHGNKSPRKPRESNGSTSLNFLNSREHTDKRREVHGSKRLNSSEQRDTDRGSQNSSMAEQFVSGRGDPHSVEQFSNLASKNFNVVEPLNSSLRYRNSNLYEQLHAGSIDPNLSEPCNRNATAAEISKSHETISAILVEKLSNSRDAINLMLAEKLKSDHNPSYVGDDQINYEEKKMIYSEELQNIRNLIAAQRSKEIERKSSPTQQVVEHPTSPSELLQKRPIECRSASQSDVCTNPNQSSGKPFSNTKSVASVSALSP